jgi:GWxTD domain-containing protein
VEGHLQGGLLHFGVIPCAFLVAALAGCTSAAERTRAEGPVARLAVTEWSADFHRTMGLLTGPDDFPAVAGFSFLAGPADSTWVVLSVSIPAAALRFQRDATGFVATYRAGLVLLQDGSEVRRLHQDERVHVPTYAETLRTDESVVHQVVLSAAPGVYEVVAEVVDGGARRGFTARDTLMVPSFSASDQVLSATVVYGAGERVDRAQRPDLITNPRRMTYHGGAPPLVYLEVHDSAIAALSVQVLDHAGREVWSNRLTLPPSNSRLRGVTCAIPADDLGLGSFSIVASVDGAVAARTSILLAMSEQWMAANFEDIAGLLRFMATEEEVSGLANGTPVEIRQRWDAFWARRDPDTATPVNAFRDAFFRRIRMAGEAFREPGVAGWQTDRGIAFIVLGEPDYMNERSGAGSQQIVEWVYDNAGGARLHLEFSVRGASGHYQLTPAALTAFRGAADRVQRQAIGR